MQKMYRIPAQCSFCEQGFDLGYDLMGVSEEKLVAKVINAAARAQKGALLCWDCRN